MDQDKSSSSQSKCLESFLKERLEESKSFQKDQNQEKSTISGDINPIEEDRNEILDKEESETELQITKRDSDKNSLPKIGDKVKVKYPDGWYTGTVDRISSKKKYFWVDFKGFDDLYKVRRSDKFKII